MNHKYFKAALDKVADLCRVIDNRKADGVCFDRPTEIFFLESWAEDGFKIIWKQGGGRREFQIICVWHSETAVGVTAINTWVNDEVTSTKIEGDSWNHETGSMIFRREALNQIVDIYNNWYLSQSR